MWEIYTEAVPFQIPGYPLVGVIGGRPYIDLSLLASMGRVFGMDSRKFLQRAENVWGRVPEEVEIPLLPMTNLQMLRSMLPALFTVRKALHVESGRDPSIYRRLPWLVLRDTRSDSTGELGSRAGSFMAR